MRRVEASAILMAPRWSNVADGVSSGPSQRKDRPKRSRRPRGAFETPSPSGIAPPSEVRFEWPLNAGRLDHYAPPHGGRDDPRRSAHPQRPAGLEPHADPPM